MTGFRNPPLRFSSFFVISHAHKAISQYSWRWQSCLCFIHTEKGLLLWLVMEDEHVPVLLPNMWNNRGYQPSSAIGGNAGSVIKISWASNQPGSPARRNLWRNFALLLLLSRDTFPSLFFHFLIHTLGIFPFHSFITCFLFQLSDSLSWCFFPLGNFLWLIF